MRADHNYRQYCNNDQSGFLHFSASNLPSLKFNFLRNATAKSSRA
jgi:hypothetical protein